MNVSVNDGVSTVINQSKRIVVINEKEIPFHSKMTGSNMTTINGKVYIDGFEYKNGVWKRTLKALFHKWF